VPGYYNKNKTQMAEHYNLTIQRQLDKATVLTVGYVGTAGHHIQRGIPLLWGNAALCESLAGCGPGGEGGVYVQNGQTYYGTFTGLINNQAISANYTNSAGGPVSAYAQATWLQNSGNSNYNSLQVSAERKARDLTLLVSYTWAHSFDSYSAAYDPRTPSRNYGPSTFDIRNNLVMSYNWELPFARLFGARRITTGWHLAGITRFADGTPVSLQGGGDYALTNLGLDYPTQVGPQVKSACLWQSILQPNGVCQRPELRVRSLWCDGHFAAVFLQRPGHDQYRCESGERHKTYGVGVTELPPRDVQRLQSCQLPFQWRDRQSFQRSVWPGHHGGFGPDRPDQRQGHFLAKLRVNDCLG
jgi:hypothetical protein